MNNYLLEIRKSLIEELEQKRNYIKMRADSCTYINTEINKLKENFYKLMEKEITLEDFKKDIEEIDKRYIFESTTQPTLKTIDQISKYKNNPLYVQNFYNNLNTLNKYLKSIIQNKETQILLKEQEIDTLNEFINNINEDGSLKYHLSDKNIEELKKIPCLSTIMSKENLPQILFEIALKNLDTQKKQLEKLEQKQQKAPKPITKPKESNINIYEQAKNIILENIDKIGNLTETEELFFEDIKNTNNINEIENAITMMETKKSSLKLIIYGLKDTLEKNDISNTKIIEKYISLYNIYKIEQREPNEELDKLYEKYEEIKDIENPTSELTEKQKLELDSLKNIDNPNDEMIEAIEQTLEQYGLNIELSLLYNKYLKISEKIKEFEEAEEIFDDEDLKKKLIEIIKEFEKYEEIKNKYIEKIEQEKLEEKEKIKDKQKEKDDNENILLYLTDKDNITFAEKQMLESKTSGKMKEYVNNLKYLINELKTNDSTYITIKSRKVKPETPDYKKKRLVKGDIRLVFIILNNKPLNTDKSVYLVITAGEKTESKQAPVYIDANRLKSKVLEYIKYYTEVIGKKTKKEKEDLIKLNKQFEEELIANLETKEAIIEAEKEGGKTNGI